MAGKPWEGSTSEGVSRQLCRIFLKANEHKAYLLADYRNAYQTGEPKADEGDFQVLGLVWDLLHLTPSSHAYGTNTHLVN